MKNDTKIINEITQKIEERACYGNPGPVAVDSGKFIDTNFLLIRRSDLPEVAISLQTGRGHTDGLTESSSGGNPDKLRKVAYQYLAIADFIDAKKDKEAKAKLQQQRWEAYSTIYPYQNMYTFDSFDYMRDTQINVQRAIDEIVKLRSQLAK